MWLLMLKVSSGVLISHCETCQALCSVVAALTGIDGKLKKMCERLLKLWDASKVQSLIFFPALELEHFAAVPSCAFFIMTTTSPCAGGIVHP